MNHDVTNSHRARPLACLLLVAAVTAVGCANASADDEAVASSSDAIAGTSWVYIPNPGWSDAAAMARDQGNGARKIMLFNDTPGDLVTVDVWFNGRSQIHQAFWPVLYRQQDSVDYNVFLDATVTRWKDCNWNRASCRIAGVYKFSGLNTPNGPLPEALWPMVPRP